MPGRCMGWPGRPTARASSRAATTTRRASGTRRPGRPRWCIPATAHYLASRLGARRPVHRVGSRRRHRTGLGARRPGGRAGYGHAGRRRAARYGDPGALARAGYCDALAARHRDAPAARYGDAPAARHRDHRAAAGHADNPAARARRSRRSRTRRNRPPPRRPIRRPRRPPGPSPPAACRTRGSPAPALPAGGLALAAILALLGLGVLLRTRGAPAR